MCIYIYMKKDNVYRKVFIHIMMKTDIEKRNDTTRSMARAFLDALDVLGLI
jgi:hypothetical protein